MKMNSRLLHRSVAATVFAISAVQFFITAQPTVSFWDPGELSAAACMLQVPHPPGGPLFSLVGRFFYLLPMRGDPGFRMNMVSVVSSALAVLFVYLIAVRLIRRFRPTVPEGPADDWATPVAAAIGALALSFCDSFWFNGVEANYFAASTFLFTAMLWLLLVWDEKADEPGSGRYLLMIAYLAGLSAGVHLMSVPTVFTVAMVVVFRRSVADDAACRRSALLFAGQAALLLAVAFVWWDGMTSTQVPSPEQFFAYDRKFVLVMGAISCGYMALFWKRVFRKDSFYMPVLVAAAALFATYPGVIKLLPKLIQVISGNSSSLGIAILAVILALLGYAAYVTAARARGLLHTGLLALLFVILGFSTYTMIVTRANVHPPMNENNPGNFAGLLTYLNREQYGEFPVFERRWTPEADRQRTWTEYKSDLDFFLRYQMQHMFNRYILFNFAGRGSREQDADPEWGQLAGIPLVVGLFGLFWHFRRDWRMGASLALLFIIMGYLIAFYQNQQEPQPRERDYFYAGAYAVFAIWIALGVRGLLEVVAGILRAPKARGAGYAAVLLAATAFIPARMFQANFATHDRSRNWLAWDYAYDMLQTCEQGAILFTNGDNDTFPLWFMQDVEGVRRDVRVVNLSLVNTPWYIRQMKDRPYYPEATAVPISIPDNRIPDMDGLIPWDPQTVTIPVPPGAGRQEAFTDTAIFNPGSFGAPPLPADTGAGGGEKIQFVMRNTVQYGRTKAIRVQDFMVKNIIETNRWQRPIYFAITCPPDSRIGIDEYLRFCGLAWRLVPYRASRLTMGIDPDVLAANLFNEPADFSRTPRYGYKFRTTADTTVVLDENEAHMVSGFRSAFRALAIFEDEGRHDLAKSARVMDRLEHVIPWTTVPMLFDEGYDFAIMEYRLGLPSKAAALTSILEREFRAETAGGPPGNPYIYGQMIRLYELGGMYRQELALLEDIARLQPGDPSVKARIDTVRAMMRRSGQSTAN
ncbi:MAG TPA: DUF2723 domain-containing protein [Bacteroidota bacterium]|nr:DUF2723 domain-containing protein [Bacteroidota bacterium]